MINFGRSHSWYLGLPALAVLTLAGCDLTGQYEARFQEALKKGERQAAFDVLHADPIPELNDAAKKPVGVTLRIPKLFDGNGKSLPPTDKRANPPFLAIPGLTYAMERQIDDAGGKWLPAYVYFAAIPKADQKAAALQTALMQQTAAALPGAAWSDVQVLTPEGSSLALKRLRGDGPQEFMNLQKKPPVPVKTAGRFDLYYIDAGNYHVLIGWRAPQAQAQKNSFDAATDAAMGTLQVTAEAPAGKAAPGCF